MYSSQDVEASWMSTHRWMDKEIVVHINNGMLLSHKKEHIWISCSEVDELELVIQSEVSQKKEKYHILMHVYGI